MDLPVSYLSDDHSMPMKRTLSDLEKYRSQTYRNDIGDKELSQIYDCSQLEGTSNNFGRQKIASSAAPPITAFQREASVYNGLPAVALAPQQPLDMELMQSKRHSPLSVLSDHNLQDQLRTEASGQKVGPLKEIEDYKKKAASLRQELDTLKDQRNELRGDSKRSPSPETKRFLKDNTKLQLEIQNKLKTINNVLDMLNGIIVDQTKTHETEESVDRKHKSRSPSGRKFNYVFYDPEMHWCRACNEFPPTAKDYLNHLHSTVHQKMAAEHTEAPWHGIMNANEGYPIFPSAPTKRTPIKGLQFFVPATAWFCKLCDQFIGDLHCASAHIKSVVHSKNYANFVEQNPHWETDWMSDRQKAFEKARYDSKLKPVENNREDINSCSVKYTAHTITITKDSKSQPQKRHSPDTDESRKYMKKNKNRSDSQSSVSDNSENENFKQKKPRNKKLLSTETRDNKDFDGLNSPTPERLSDDDRKLLETIKSRMKRSREERDRSNSRERERIRTMQQRIRESERRGRSSEKRGDSRDRRDNSRDRREWSRDRRDMSRNRRGMSRDRRDMSRDRRDMSRDRRDMSRDRRDDYRDRWNDRPDRRVRQSDSKDRQSDNKDRQPDSEERQPDSKDRQPDSRDRPADSRNEKTERLHDSQNRKEASPNRDNPSENQDQQSDGQAAESKKQASSAQPIQPMSLPLPLPTPIPPATTLPPLAMPPLQPWLQTPESSLPSVPKEFQEALEILFPTDPQKCTEMLNAMQQQQQPSLLGIPPGFGMPFSPLGIMQPPRIFGFDHTALFSQPSPLLPMMPGANLNKPIRQNRNIRTKFDRARNRPNSRPPRRANGNPTPEMKPELDELMMLGIDASDVGARI